MRSAEMSAGASHCRPVQPGVQQHHGDETAQNRKARAVD